MLLINEESDFTDVRAERIEPDPNGPNMPPVIDDREIEFSSISSFFGIQSQEAPFFLQRFRFSWQIMEVCA